MSDIKETMEERYKKAAMRHFSQNTGKEPEIDGVIWVASEDVKEFIKQEIALDREQRDREVRRRIEELLKTPAYNSKQTYDTAIKEVLSILFPKE